MKAMILKNFGGVENFEITDIPFDAPKENEVSIKIKALSINPLDIETRKGNGLAPHFIDPDFRILGWDISGEIIATGAKVTGFNVGDEVFGSVSVPGRGCAYASFINAPEAHLALKPFNVSHEAAAATSLAALVAFQAFNGNTSLKRGDQLLIHGAAGGIGHFAVQMALQSGAYVIAASEKKHLDFVMDLGAHRHIAYDDVAFENEVSNLDFVLDTIGGDFAERSLKAIKWGGHLVTLSNEQRSDIVETAAYNGVNARLMLATSNGDDMFKISELLKNSNLKPHIFKSFTFDNIPEAHTFLEAGGVEGKIVITMDDPVLAL